MSEDKSGESQSNAQSQEQDPIKQIKSEFGRKQDNVMNELNSLKSQLSQIADTVIQAAATKRSASESSEEMPDPVMDPKGYKEYMRKELRRDVDESLNAERERNTVLSSLVANYPELQSGSSELTQTALRIYNSLSPSEKASPSGYKIAVMQAAQEVGVLPANKRQKQSQGEEDFTLSSSSSTARQKPSQRAKEEKIDDKTLEFAKLLGRPVNDDKYIERLKTTISSRKRNWSRFE